MALPHILDAAVLVPALAVLLAIYIVASLYLNYRKFPQFNGPILASTSGVWLFRETVAGRMYSSCAEALEKYGSPVRIKPDMIVTDDPVIVRHMSAPRSRFTRGIWYDPMSPDPDIKNSLAERDEKAHNILRTKLIRGYSGKDIPTLEPDIDARIVELIALIRSETAKGKLVDMARLSQYFTLDVLTRIAFGAPFGYLTRNEDVYQYIKETTGFLSVLELACNFTFFNRILSSRLLRPFAPKTTDKTGMGAMLGVAKNVVAERYAPDAKVYPDMMGSFLKCGLSQQEAESESMLTILGGSDSTATAIRMTLLYILTSPSVYAKLIAELDSNVDDTTAKSVIKYAAAKKLPYLQACIREGLRMWPPFAGLQSKIAPPGGETVNGVFLPAGIEIGYNQHATMRRKEVFGADVNVFRPERWLRAEGAPLQEMDRTVDLVFGSGRFSCLGKDVAVMELSKVFPALLTEFEWTVVNPAKPLKTLCWGAHVQSDFWLAARERGKAVG